MSTLVAKANEGGGTDQLAVFPVPDGLAGAVVPVDSSTGSPIALATSAKQDTAIASLASIDGKFPATQTGTPSSDTAANPVRVVGQKTWACSFTDSGASVLSSDFTLRTSGTGVTYNQTSGSLNVGAGTTARAEWLARGTQAFKGAFTLGWSLIASQRIANNNLYILLADKIGEDLSCTINSATSITVTIPSNPFSSLNVGQSMFVGAINGAAGVPGRYAIASVSGNDVTFTVAGWPASGSCTVDLFGWNHHKILYNGTTATSALFDAQRKGWASGDGAPVINTTASPGHIGHYAVDGRHTYLMDALRVPSTTPAFSTRGSKYENIPDEAVDLYLYIWSANGTTAPASSTTWTIGFVAVESYAAMPVLLQGNKPQGQTQSFPVTVVGGVTASLAAGANLAGDFSQQYRAGATGAASVAKVVSAATTNATVVKASAGKVVGGFLSNTTASWVYLKWHNAATTPTAGASVYAVLGLPPNATVPIDFAGGMAFATGIAYTTVTGAADADATAVAANAIVGTILYA